MALDFIPARWLTAILGCIGFVVVYGLKVNLSVAIVAMVNHTAVEELSLKHRQGDAEVELDSFENTTDSHAKKESDTQNGPFVWDEMIQGYVLASYFYGYIITQIPGGWVAEKFSAKHVFGAGALLNIIGTLLFPLASKLSWTCAIVIRVIMGIAGGVTLPGMHVLIANWAPPQERSILASTIYAGMTIGTLLCMPMSGLLASYVNWEAIFYVQGGLSIIWYILWLIFVYDSPSVHPNIKAEERDFIISSIGAPTKIGQRPVLPIKDILKSPAVWAIIVAHTCSNWGWYMLLVKLPTYMRYILKFDMKSNAVLSAIPFVFNYFFTIINAKTMDYLLGKKIITTTIARKISTFTAMVPPSICLILVTYVGSNTNLAVVLIVIGTMFVGGMYSGFLANHIDLAPQFAGTLMGISNTFATVPGIVMPSLIGIITHGNQTVEAWRIIFFLTFGIALSGATFYLIFGSGEKQKWAEFKDESQQDEMEKLNSDEKEKITVDEKEKINGNEKMKSNEPAQV